MSECRYFIILFVLFLILGNPVAGQNAELVSVKTLKRNINTKPDNVVNIPLFVKNNSNDSVAVQLKIIKPEGWSLITNIKLNYLKPQEQKFLIISTRVPALCPVNSYDVGLQIKTENGEFLAEGITAIKVEEVEKIALELLESVENIQAGQTYTGQFLLRNLGNSKKTIFIETTNCDVVGDVHIKLNPGESSKISVVKHTSEEIASVRKEYIKVNALLGGEVKNNIFRPLMIFPVKSFKKDLFFRYPIEATISYLAANANQEYSSAYQFEFSGKGPLDPGGKHYLEFLARGPNNSKMSYFGSYDQYFVGYKTKNLEVSIGQKSYTFTKLAESSRYGFGVENKILLNNGLSAGIVYVKPRYFQDIKQEMAVYAQYEKNKDTEITLYLIEKENVGIKNSAYLFSISSKFKPLKTTSLDLEFSRGFVGNVADNAYRINASSHISVLSVNGVYYNVGKNYPGYYSNSKFYSGSLSARLSKKTNIGIVARRDFSNAELDTFFVTAPYTKSIQYYLNYKVTARAQFRVYWRSYERKDRLTEDKFHYETETLNSQFSHRLNRFSYYVHGGYGQTTNYQLSEVSNEQNTYQFSVNSGFKFSRNLSVNAFGSYSNLNSFVSGEQRNATVGASATAQIKTKLRANIRLQNAYNIDEYYKNRNLMQFNLDYKISKNHEFAFRSYYTLFRNQTENPEFFISAAYKYKFGVPLKQVIKAGNLKGRLTDDLGEPRKGVLVGILNKTAITNDNGEFEFRTLPPGIYILRINRSKFALNEMPNLPKPFKIEIIEDQETYLNIGITKGAKFSGKFILMRSDGSDLKPEEKPELDNIVIELSNGIERYRITTEKDGSFSFPLVLPGSWNFVIYGNSLPRGFILDKNTHAFLFKAGETRELSIELKQKKRKIIFKSTGITLSNSSVGGFKPLKNTTKVSPKKQKTTDEILYTIQIGAFSKRLDKESSFFKGNSFDYEKHINNLYKYYIGEYRSKAEADKMMEKLREQYRGAFVVAVKNDRIIYINDQ